MYAIIRDGSKQLKVEKGQTYPFDLKAGRTGAVEFKDVLVLHDGEKVRVGAPTLAGAKVVGEVVGVLKDRKVRVFNYRRREGYHRTVGHRQKYTLVKITEIVSG